MTFWEQLMAIDWPIVIAVSVITSFIFLVFLTFIRPIICISKVILFDSNINDKLAFKIKVVNWTMFNVYEVKARLSIITRYGDGNSTYSVRRKNIALATGEVMYIPSMLSNHGKKEAKYAKIFHTYEDLSELWTENAQYLEFSLLCKHSLSGYSKLAIKQYTDKDVIKEGRFKYGKFIKIKD